MTISYPRVLQQHWHYNVSRQPTVPCHSPYRAEHHMVQESTMFLALHRLSWNAASCTHPSSNSVWSLPQCSVYGEQEQEWFSLQGVCMHLHCHLEVYCHTPVYPVVYKQHLENDRTNGLHSDSSKVKLHGNSSMNFFPRQWQKKMPQTKVKPLTRGFGVFFCLF